MAKRPVLLIHGYSDRGESFREWARILAANGYATHEVHAFSYVSLANEISVKDIAEGFDRALRLMSDNGIKVDEFDAVVHSTGMLVLRSWLAASPTERLPRVKHLIGLAPATFGSPLAHKGRSWLGAIFKGNKEPGPDFMEAGDQVLDALELGSRFTWDLSEQDLFGDTPFYSTGGNTPFVFIFCGNKAYTGLGSLVNEPGTDGTVRWAGCPVNSRKIIADLTIAPGTSKARFKIEPWKNNDSDLVAIDGANHSTIVRAPTPDLTQLVLSALEVTSKPKFAEWKTTAAGKSATKAMRPYQQFVVHAVDERGDGIRDFNIQLFGSADTGVMEFTRDVHKYSGGHSYRCFHVDLTKLRASPPKKLWLRVIATSGSALVGYHGFGSDKITADGLLVDPEGKWDGEIDLTPMLNDTGVQFFFPFTTTFIELRLNREPLPLMGKNSVCWRLDGA